MDASYERLLTEGSPLNELKGKNLAAMLGKTKSVADLNEMAKYNSEAGGFEFGTVVAIRKFDDVDWRAIEKTMGEMQARLPIKFVLPKGFDKLLQERRLRKYDSVKKHFARQQFRPDTWDMGEEANGCVASRSS